jgi:steroid delta-isomerase-like uncharacterized protein
MFELTLRAAYSSSPMPTLTPQFLADFTKRWMGAWNRFDTRALNALCTRDVVYIDPGWPVPMRGHDEVATFLKSAERAFPDMHFIEPEPPVVASPERALGTWEFTATFTGRLDPPGFAPTGAPIRARGIDEWYFRDGLVARYQTYFDSYTVARMIGAAPAVGSRVERVGAMLQRAVTRLTARR